MTFGEKLKEARKLSGLSQEKFAEALNISRSAVAKWENNIGIPDVSNLKSISKLLKISIDYLLNEDEECEEIQIRTDIIADVGKVNDASIEKCLEYEGYCCTIELTGWNDGVFDVIIIGQDSNFLYYQRKDRKRLVYGMIGRKYIVSISKTKEIKDIPKNSEMNRLYFIDKRVTVEVTNKDGILKGFFDFRNDDYLDVTIKKFGQKELELKPGHVIDIDAITKIEEL